MHLKGTRPDSRVNWGDTLGAMLRRRRTELGLRRIDAAKLLNVDPKTLMWWERDTYQPLDRAYPALIQFLDYEPWDEPATLSEALIAERKRRGQTQDLASISCGVDQSTWSYWERGEWRPMGRTANLIDTYLGFRARDRYPADFHKTNARMRRRPTGSRIETSLGN